MNLENRPSLPTSDIRERTVRRTPLELIEEFAASDISHIDTLDGLSEETERVRQALNAIIIFKGDKQRVSAGIIPESPALETYEIDRMLPGDKETLFMKTDGERLHIHRSTNTPLVDRNGSLDYSGEEQYLLEFPVEGRFSDSAEFGSIRAMQRSNPGSISETHDEFLPTSEPDNPDVLQGFTKVLQQGLRDLRSVL